MKKISTDILIVGGGASGVCAAVQAGRTGLNVVVVEETDWLGGMLTAAGVSAIDGNHKLPSGIWGEFRAILYDHYGGPENVYTGWVSNTCFEPAVANRIWHRFVENIPSVTIIKNHIAGSALKAGNRVTGGRFKSESGEDLEVSAAITIDATEYGDFLALAGCAYRIGRDRRADTGEAMAPLDGDDVIQDLTYTAILKDYGVGADRTIAKPEGYDPEIFRGCCREWAGANTGGPVSSAIEMLEYGRLPNNKFMINWPRKGNDFYVNLLEMDQQKRREQLAKAKHHTLCFVYFIQNQLGFRNLGLADDEFLTTDRLPLIPYIRESRRLKGIVTMTMDDIVDPYKDNGRSCFRTGIAVGNYPLDHHHSDNNILAEENFPGIPAYTIPFGCLVPESVEGLLVAEKSISVSHIVNGTTRLQPVVMQLGQVAGAAAAMCVKQKVQPIGLNVRSLQQELLESGCWLLPFTDIDVNQWGFRSIQRVGLAGLMRGEGRAKDWANEFCFDPDGMVTWAEAEMIVSRATGRDPAEGKTGNISRIEMARMIWTAKGKPDSEVKYLDFTDLDLDNNDMKAVKYLAQSGCFEAWPDGDQFHARRLLSRRMLAWLIDHCFDPFNSQPVDIHCQAEKV